MCVKNIKIVCKKKNQVLPIVAINIRGYYLLLIMMMTVCTIRMHKAIEWKRVKGINIVG